VLRGVLYVPDKMGWATGPLRRYSTGAKRRPVQSRFQLDRCIVRIDRCGARSGLMLHWIGGNGLRLRCSIEHAGYKHGKCYQA
jgi:hypothetical protein